MTWRLAIDRWRSDRRRQAREQAAFVPPPGATAEDVAASNERTARLWQAIDSLPEKLRIVIVLGAIHGHDVREVAQLLDVPEGTVKSRLFLARKGLAQRLQCLVPDTSAR
jgi:RNA polymerase sigma-70 factor (ECF subfamily)